MNTKTRAVKIQKSMQRVFLAALPKNYGLPYCTCVELGIPSWKFRDWLNADPDYRSKVIRVIERCEEANKRMAWRSLLNGVRRGSRLIQNWVRKEYGETFLQRILNGENPGL